MIRSGDMSSSQHAVLWSHSWHWRTTYRHMDMYITWELLSISGCKVCYQNISHSQHRESPSILVAKLTKVIRANSMSVCITWESPSILAEKLTNIHQIQKNIDIYTLHCKIGNRPLFWLQRWHLRFITARKVWTCVSHGNCPVFWL